MKISILTPDFSQNCFGRAWLLTKLLQRYYDVEMIGPAFGDGIWKPLSYLCDFETKMVKGNASGQFEFRKMLNMISGDVIYASKPVIASFGLGLIKKIRTRKPLVLDIDDWELGFGKQFYGSLIWPKKIYDFLLSLSDFRSFPYALISDKLVRFANALTVSGRTLQARYGGAIVWHGRDLNAFDPEKFDKIRSKSKYLPDKDRKSFIVGFIGTPRPHKGLEDLIDAMELLRYEGILLMIVGMHEDRYCMGLKNKIENSKVKDKVIFFPEQPFDKLPEFLSIADVMVIPQRERPASYGQVPAKVFDAMAMAKPIVATSIFDIPEILSRCGWIVEPENPKRLAEAIQYVFDHPTEAKEMGWKAREKCKREYSWVAIEKGLVNVFSKYE